MALAALLAACGPAEKAAEPGAAAPALALDCDRGFSALEQEILAAPGFAEAPAPGEPYRFLNHESGSPSFVITLPEAPAHPAILKQEAHARGMTTTGCHFGDPTAFGELIAYIESLGPARGRPSGGGG